MSADQHGPSSPSAKTIDVPDSGDHTPVVAAEAEPAQKSETIASPAKVMRIGSMVRQLLEEVRSAPLDEAGRARMKEIYDVSVRELASGLSPDLTEELARIAIPLSEGTPSEAELRIAQAQLVGWLEGLFHGIQATLMAQQVAAKNQLIEIQRGPRGLVPGVRGETGDSGSGQYL